MPIHARDVFPRVFHDPFGPALEIILLAEELEHLEHVRGGFVIRADDAQPRVEVMRVGVDERLAAGGRSRAPILQHHHATWLVRGLPPPVMLKHPALEDIGLALGGLARGFIAESAPALEPLLRVRADGEMRSVPGSWFFVLGSPVRGVLAVFAFFRGGFQSVPGS